VVGLQIYKQKILSGVAYLLLFLKYTSTDAFWLSGCLGDSKFLQIFVHIGNTHSFSGL